MSGIAPARERENLDALDLAAFVVVGFAFSRISESVEAATGIFPISVVLAAGAVAFALLRRAERPPVPPMFAVSIALGAFYLAVAAFSMIGAQDQGLAFESVKGQLTGIVLMAATVFLVRTPRRLDLALRGITVATLVVASVNCWQVLTGAYHSTFLGLAHADFAALDRASGWRLGGPVGDPNFFAQMLVPGVAVSAMQAVFRHGRARALGAAAAATGVTALLFTYSRGGLLALFVAAAVLSVRLLSLRAVLTAAAVSLLLVVLAPSALTGRIGTAVAATPKALAGQDVADTAINGRASEAIVGYRQFSDHWLLGVGPGNYPVHYLDYAGPLGLDSRGIARQPHSLIIETLAETGIVGLVALAAAIIVAFASIGSLRASTRASREDRALWYMGASVEAALVAHLACALFLHSAYERGLWLLLGLALACAQLRHSRAPTPTTARERVVS